MSNNRPPSSYQQQPQLQSNKSLMPGGFQQPQLQQMNSSNLVAHAELQLPTLTKNASSHNYTTKKGKQQNWINQQKNHKMIDTERLLKGFDSRNDSKSFIFTIKSLVNIPMKDIHVAGGQEASPVPSARYSLEFYVTLFNKELGTNGNFYGRTYRSQPLPLKDSNGTWETAQEVIIYLNSNYIQKTSFAVVECVICKEIGGIKSYGSIGYGLCHIFESISSVTTIEIMKGSPRSIGLVGLDVSQAKTQKAPTKLTFEMRDFQQFDKLKLLIPPNCLCGMHEIIPGLVGDYMPNPKSGVKGNLGGPQVNIELCKSQKIYIHNIQMLCSIAFENRFLAFLKAVKLQKIKTQRGSISPGQNENVYISERRILVSVNNTWKNVNDENFMQLGSPNDIGISNSGGSIQLNNYICNQSVALVFRIEYKAVLPNEKFNEQLNFNLGWCCHIPSLNSLGEVSDENLEIDIILGPGQTPTGELLWDPNADDINYYQIKLKACISTNSKAPYQSSNEGVNIGGRTSINNPNINNNNRLPNSQNSDPYVAAQENKMMMDKQRQIQELEQRLNQQKRSELEFQQRVEQLELQRLQGGGNQNQIHGEGDRRLNDQMKLVQMQKDQLQNEVYQIRQEMKTSLELMQQVTPQQQHHNYPQQYGNQQYGQQPYGQTPYGHGHQQPNNYGDAMYHNMQQPLNLNQDSASQIAMISNVFYNMLNMIGETEKDKKIIGLSDNLKKMVQQQRFDDLLAPKVPFVGMGQINLLKTTDLPLTDQVNFIKMGYGDLLQHPSAQITSSAIQKDRLSLEVEAEDQLKACTISFKFICFKTPWSGIDKIPSRFYFQFKFFTFPTVITDKVKMRNPSELEGRDEIRPNQTYYLIKDTFMGAQIKMQVQVQKDTYQDPNLLSIIFEIDPSISRVKDENIEIAKYLKERYVNIDIFDGDSLFLYGTCKVPLFELLRQGRSSVVRAKECEMCDPESGEFRGSIQLIMSNQGKIQSISQEEYKKKENSPVKQRSQPSQADHASGKQHKFKKVVKSNPMDLTKQQQSNSTVHMAATHTGLMHQSSNNFSQSVMSQISQTQAHQASVQNPDLRKKLRVDRVRKMTLGQTSTHMSIEDPNQPDWAKFKSLREIELIRETKKEDIINRVLNDYVSNDLQLSVVPGKLEFFTIPIHNTFNQSEVFIVHICDPDSTQLITQEVELVHNAAEWRHWASQNKCKKPDQYDIISGTKDVILKPNTQVELLFKFLTLRDFSNNPNEQSSVEIIKARKVKVTIIQSNHDPYVSCEINISPSSAIIDQTFRYYEPQNSHISLKIPPFLQLNYPGLIALISRPTSIVDINKETSIIIVETKIDDAPQIQEMTLFLYGDQFKEKLLATVRLEVYALVTVYTKIKAGIQSTLSLAIPSENARSIMIHSSNKSNVYLPKRALNQQYRLIPQTINHIQICTKTFSSFQEKARIHAVDVNTGELVYAWLLIIDSERPNVTAKHDVVCKVNQQSSQSLQFANKLSMSTVYEFASSRPDYVKLKVDQVHFDGKAQKDIDLIFPAQQKYGSAEVYMFASDIDQNVVECHLLRIAYLP